MANNAMETMGCLGDSELAGPQMPLVVKQSPETHEEPADDSNSGKEASLPDNGEDITESVVGYEVVIASVASTVTEYQQEDASEGESDDEEDGSDHDDELELYEESVTRPEMSAHLNGHPDNEVEHHDAADVEISQEAMTEASRTILFRRYSKMTPTDQERSFHEETLNDHMLLQHSSVCPKPTAQSCHNPACADQICWRDARIAELQAALDHMTEAMAIQQRDMASQRVYLSRQAEQLTNLSNKLHQEKVALHVERERFQQSIAISPMSIANKLKPAAGKLKSPVKKILSAAANRRASFTSATTSSGVHNASSASTITLDTANRSTSSSQLRLNPLFSESSTAPLTDRSASLSVLELKVASKQGAIAITPPKANFERVASPTKIDSAMMVDIKLNDGLSPQKSVISSTSMESPGSIGDVDAMRRVDREESISSQSADQKKLSIGDRFRSIRWGRS